MPDVVGIGNAAEVARLYFSAHTGRSRHSMGKEPHKSGQVY
eukprot:CAMPEP_0177368982 /NCGR_PEP_ID=MMETSP0368-20130122/41218_1 /TAXON_ID=447022 ORGANISM="Scrippsiella hangoei-like, Strain SHHI-4" /NCGR_SAMPLE_ID=MMETSP0368 /ASSEMBLY_ACC=CAM_ASM_000363 /LENGTH=40 /DNA_ID= /DNA_START= /DNA_END= /DNA_ORIENTATION=